MRSLSRVWLFATPWTVAYQAPPSMGFSRQECWSGLPFPSPGDLPDPGIKPGSPALQADALLSEPPGKHSNKVIFLQIIHGVKDLTLWTITHHHVGLLLWEFFFSMEWITVEISWDQDGGGIWNPPHIQHPLPHYFVAPLPKEAMCFPAPWIWAWVGDWFCR